MKRNRAKRAASQIEWEASHSPFEGLIAYCVRGHANALLQSCAADDHIAELCELLHDDIDDDLWRRGRTTAVGTKAREMLAELANRAIDNADYGAAKLLYSIATQAAYEVLSLYLRRRELFDQITPHRKLLPCLQSIHPRTSAVTSRMRQDARLGEKTDDSRRLGSKAWFLTDAPANVYARAIIVSVELNRHLEPAEKQQANRDRTAMLPFPKFVAGLAALPVPLTPASVLDYWRKGKEIILEELPEFHERPEWQEYRTGRRYSHGAKTGVIQHAIFKDILVALRTIAGANKRRPTAAASKSFPAAQ